jgi:hypothetical protein
MAEPKYRPCLTLPEIEAVIESLESLEALDSLARSALITLRLLALKAGSGRISAAYVPTGTKPGRMSAVDLIRGDIPAKQEVDEFGPVGTYPRAVEEAKTYRSLNMPVPTNIQAILDKGEE